MSRPRRTDEPTKPYTLRLSPSERERIDRAAKVNRQRPSDFARDALVTAAEDCLEDRR